MAILQKIFKTLNPKCSNTNSIDPTKQRLIQMLESGEIEEVCFEEDVDEEPETNNDDETLLYFKEKTFNKRFLLPQTLAYYKEDNNAGDYYQKVCIAADSVIINEVAVMNAGGDTYFVKLVLMYMFMMMAESPMCTKVTMEDICRITKKIILRLSEANGIAAAEEVMSVYSYTPSNIRESSYLRNIKFILAQADPEVLLEAFVTINLATSIYLWSPERKKREEERKQDRISSGIYRKKYEIDRGDTSQEPEPPEGKEAHEKSLPDTEFIFADEITDNPEKNDLLHPVIKADKKKKSAIQVRENDGILTFSPAIKED